MFKTYDYKQTYWWNDNDSRKNNIAFWYNYTQGNVDSASIDKALYECSVADIDNGTNGFFIYLHNTNDADALRYWTINKTFSSKIDNPWYYPNRAEKLEMKRLANEVDDILHHCTSIQLKERYIYLMMRLSFYLKHYETCRNIWKKHKLAWTDNELRRKCQLYYAGALFYSGQATTAADIYADNGEWESLRYFDQSVAFMRELYAVSPKSKAFMFFVQNYLNHMQDKRTMMACDDFVALCKKVVSEKRSDNTALWQSALAHVEFLRGNLKQAIKLIEKASSMKGYPMTIDNVRMLRLLYHSTETDASNYDENLYKDLPWLLKKVASLDNLWANNGQGFDHCLNMLARTILSNAYPHYIATGNSNMAAALLNAYDEVYCYDKKYRASLRNDTTKGSLEYNTHWFRYLDKTSIDNVKNFLAFVKSNGKTNLEKELIKSGYVRESMINELIGTKYMRIYNYDSALFYLKKVQPSFFKKQNITPFLDRNPFRENWISSDKLKGYTFSAYNAAARYDSMPTKMQFCKSMQHIEHMLKTSASKEERAAMNYLFVIGLVQSKDWCWALTQYANGSTSYGMYNSLSICSNKDFITDSWDYKSSPSYEFQNNYRKVCSHLDATEKLTSNIELAARCQYMRCVIELDKSYKWQLYHKLLINYDKTYFVDNESRHCSTLADYR